MNGAEVLTRFTADTSGVDKAVKNTNTSLGKLVTAFTLGNVAASAINKTFQVMAQNLDGAISRYDTLNNFPRVMSNLGIGADEADASIKKLSDKLTGLPTSLDNAASAVQRLTSKNGNVEESTDMFLALNGTLPVMSKYIDNGLVTADDTAIPCWSLAALLNLLDYPSLTQNKENEWEVCVLNCESDGYIEISAGNPVDACYKMVLKLHEKL